MRNQPKEHTEKSLPIKQTTIQNYRKTYGEEEPERKKVEEEEDEAEDEKEDKEKRQRVERLTERAEQAERRDGGVKCEGRAEMRDEGHQTAGYFGLFGYCNGNITKRACAF